MNYDYSEMLNFLLKNNVGKLNEYRPFYPMGGGRYEALIYFAMPFVLCAKLKSLEDFLTGLVNIGRKLNFFVSDDAIIKFIENRMKFYANNVYNAKLPIIVYYWLYTKPLGKFPDNENEFEFTPPSFWWELPELPKLINEVNKLEECK